MPVGCVNTGWQPWEHLPRLIPHHPSQGAVINALDDSVPGPPPGAGPLQELWYNLYRVLAVR